MHLLDSDEFSWVGQINYNGCIEPCSFVELRVKCIFRNVGVFDIGHWKLDCELLLRDDAVKNILNKGVPKPMLVVLAPESPVFISVNK